MFRGTLFGSKKQEEDPGFSMSDALDPRSLTKLQVCKPTHTHQTHARAHRSQSMASRLAGPGYRNFPQDICMSEGGKWCLQVGDMCGIRLLPHDCFSTATSTWTCLARLMGYALKNLVGWCRPQCVLLHIVEEAIACARRDIAQLLCAVCGWIRPHSTATPRWSVPWRTGPRWRAVQP